MNRILVLQHIEIETLAYLENLFKKHNFLIKIIKLYKNESIPQSVDDYDLLISLGGPMDTWMTNLYPWLKHEKELIKKFVLEIEKPFLGLCLGCQLLGETLGGKVVKSTIPEIGFKNIAMKKESKNDRLFFNFSKSYKVFQWHSCEVTKISDNPEVTILGSSKITPIQVFKYKDHAYGIQYHLELENNTILDWLKNEVYKESLIKTLGPKGIKLLLDQQKQYISDTQKLCEKLFNNILNVLKN